MLKILCLDCAKMQTAFFHLLVDALENKDPALHIIENGMQYVCHALVDSQNQPLTFNLTFDKYPSDEALAPEPNHKTSAPTQSQDQGQEGSDLKKMIQDMERSMNAKYERLEGQYSSLLRTVEDQNREIYELRNSFTTMERNNAIKESIRNNPHMYLGGGGQGPFSKKSNFL